MVELLAEGVDADADAEPVPESRRSAVYYP